MTRRKVPTLRGPREQPDRLDCIMEYVIGMLVLAVALLCAFWFLISYTPLMVTH